MLKVYASRNNSRLCYIQQPDGDYAPLDIDALREWPKAVYDISARNDYATETAEDASLGELLYILEKDGTLENKI